MTIKADRKRVTPEIQERIAQIRRGEIPPGYKRDQIGIAPVEWNNISFSDLFTATNDYTDDLQTYPLYSLTLEDGITAKTERYNRSHLVKKSESYKILRPNDYAYNPMNIRFGAVARHKGSTPVAVSGYYDIFTTVEPDDLSFMDSFLICAPMIHYYNKISTGSLLEKQRVHFSQFLDFSLPLPPLKERKKIADILSTQDKMIELKERLIAEKQRQKKYLMQRLLTGKTRLPGFHGEWKRKKLNFVLTPGDKKAVDDTSKYKKITVKLNFGGLEFSNLSRKMADTRPFYIRKENEIIIGKQNYFHGSVALVTKKYAGCICSNAIMSFSVHNANVIFILAYISQPDFMKQYEMLANGTGQKELSEKDFLNFDIFLPPIEEQKAIADILSAADEEIELLKRELEQEKRLKKALSQLLLTGIVRV